MLYDNWGMLLDRNSPMRCGCGAKEKLVIGKLNLFPEHSRTPLRIWFNLPTYQFTQLPTYPISIWPFAVEFDPLPPITLKLQGLPLVEIPAFLRKGPEERAILQVI
jgi:hypothetical protein